ncbi:MAG TPA: hypothetical protein VKA94_07080, partial [Hyphomicrobiales bacterium]|nr:hypothetical protein [Hyphomicrobiales bacterium]
IAYSPDGKYLAATLGGGRGMRIWETANWSMVASDDNYGNFDSYGATFDENNVLFTVADDGLIRRYGRGFRLELKAQVTAGQRPFQIAANPAADLLAIAFDGNLGIELFSKSALDQQGVVDTQGMEGDLSTVAWSPDGSRLFAGGKYVSGGSRPVVIWGDQGKGSRREASIGRSTVMHILPCADRVVAGSADPAIGTYTGVGIPLLHRENVIVDQRGKREDSFLVSEDGSRVRFGLGYGGDIPVIFDLKQRDLIDAPSIDPSLSKALTEGLDITNWYDEFAPMLNGKPIEMQNAERSRSLAITRDRKYFVLGTEYRLRGFSADGEQLWERSMPGVTWGVNIAGSGKVVVVACGDGTIRWYKLTDGTELLTLFVHAKDRRWVAWTPHGYYLASPGAEDLIGWHINRGWTQAADFFPANRFRDTFSRPDVVTRVLLTLDESAALSEANEKTNRGNEQQDILNTLPPVINILSPTNGEDFGRPEIQIKYTVRSPSGLPVKRIRALVDGRPIEVDARGLDGIRGTDTELTVTMPVPPRDATVALIAETEKTASEPAEVILKWSGSATVTDKPNLYAVVVGINDYKDDIIPDLKWAANDATELANVLSAQKGALYDKVDIRLLTNEEASAGAILDNLDWISRAS